MLARTTMGIDKVRVAIIHFWYVRRGGAERVLEVLANIFPRADIFIMFLDPRALQPSMRCHKITTSFLQKIPRITKHYRKLLPLFPLAQEQFQLDDYDVVISSEAGPAKGVLTRPSTCHICYCHTPMRYVWDLCHHYRSTSPLGPVGRLLYSLSEHYVRMWDYAASARVDYFVASSLNSAARIRKYYRRHADVIYPPVDVASFSISSTVQDFYLVVSRLVSYKRIDLAIAACNQLRRRLIIIGDGEQLPYLRRIAGPTITFLGSQPDEVVREHYRSCRALLFPGEEDIGLAPIEAQASGRPVIAFGKGGALETVIGAEPQQDMKPRDATGVFFREQSANCVANAINFFESIEPQLCPEFIRSQAFRFDLSEFTTRFETSVAFKWTQFNNSDTAITQERQMSSVG